MEFKFNINDVFQQPIVEINQNLIPPGFSGDRRALWDTVNKVSEVVNAMGEASAIAQGLTKPITTAERLRNSEHKLYFLIDQNANNGKGAVTGMLKTGSKGLYVFDRNGQHFQVSPPCVLDFYIHETRQRTGLGKQLFEHMLEKEEINPVKMAIDRPSDKFLGFLNKHYSLNSPVKQMNNYVVFDGFFPKHSEDADVESSKSITPSKKDSANGLQTYASPMGRYGAHRPPCSMGQIIHNQTSTVNKRQEAAGVQSMPATNYQGIQNSPQPNPYVSQSVPNFQYAADRMMNENCYPNQQYPFQGQGNLNELQNRIPESQMRIDNQQNIPQSTISNQIHAIPNAVNLLPSGNYGQNVTPEGCYMDYTNTLQNPTGLDFNETVRNQQTLQQNAAVLQTGPNVGNYQTDNMAQYMSSMNVNSNFQNLNTNQNLRDTVNSPVVYQDQILNATRQSGQNVSSNDLQNQIPRNYPNTIPQQPLQMQQKRYNEHMETSGVQNLLADHHTVPTQQQLYLSHMPMTYSQQALTNHSTPLEGQNKYMNQYNQAAHLANTASFGGLNQMASQQVLNQHQPLSLDNTISRNVLNQLPSQQFLNQHQQLQSQDMLRQSQHLDGHLVVSKQMPSQQMLSQHALNSNPSPNSYQAQYQQPLPLDNTLSGGVLNQLPSQQVLNQPLVDTATNIIGQDQMNNFQNLMNNVQNPMNNVQNPMNNVPNIMNNVQNPMNHVQNPMNNVQNPMNNVQIPMNNVQNPMNNVQNLLSDVQNPLNNDQNQMNNMSVSNRNLAHQNYQTYQPLASKAEQNIGSAMNLQQSAPVKDQNINFDANMARMSSMQELGSNLWQQKVPQVGQSGDFVQQQIQQDGLIQNAVETQRGAAVNQSYSVPNMYGNYRNVGATEKNEDTNNRNANAPSQEGVLKYGYPVQMTKSQVFAQSNSVTQPTS